MMQDLSQAQAALEQASSLINGPRQEAYGSPHENFERLAVRISQIVKATGDNKQALINVKPEDLDTVSGFGFVRLSVTVGVAASQTAAQVLGINARELPASTVNQAAVVQVV